MSSTVRTVKLVVEYEGTNYLGWQRQPQGMTVQQALEESVEKITGRATRVIGAGRTDAGVHARGMVAHFKTDSQLPVERLRDGLNGTLPRDIAVLSVEERGDDFHARFSARSKRYEYTIHNSPVRPAIDRRFCRHVRRKLDVESMRSGARYLPGRQDFAAFESSGAASGATVRTVTTAEWLEEGERLVFGIEADGFLYNMVRAVVGSLVEVGLGKQPPEWIRELILCRDRTLAGPTAPAKGLCLVRVDY